MKDLLAKTTFTIISGKGKQIFSLDFPSIRYENDVSKRVLPPIILDWFLEPFIQSQSNEYL